MSRKLEQAKANLTKLRTELENLKQEKQDKISALEKEYDTKINALDEKAWDAGNLYVRLFEQERNKKGADMNRKLIAKELVKIAKTLLSEKGKWVKHLGVSIPEVRTIVLQTGRGWLSPMYTIKYYSQKVSRPELVGKYIGSFTEAKKKEMNFGPTEDVNSLIREMGKKAGMNLNPPKDLLEWLKKADTEEELS